MKIGVEIDMVVSDSRAAFSLYEKVFGAQKIEGTDYENGLNEVVFTILGTRFHLLDENPAYGMTAPKEGVPQSSWCNLLVEDIHAVFEKVEKAGFTVIQPVTEMSEFGVRNAIAWDPFGYVWLLHQIEREVSFQERCRILESKKIKR